MDLGTLIFKDLRKYVSIETVKELVNSDHEHGLRKIKLEGVLKIWLVSRVCNWLGKASDCEFWCLSKGEKHEVVCNESVNLFLQDFYAVELIDSLSLDIDLRLEHLYEVLFDAKLGNK